MADKAYKCLLLTALALLLGGCSGEPPKSVNPAPRTLNVFVAAALKPPFDAVIQQYKKEHGVEVFVQYGTSEGLLASLRVTHKGDLYIPADDSYLESARQQNLLEETIPLVLLHPVIVVQKGNPKKILTLADLGREDIRVGLASPAAAAGKLAREFLRQSPEWATLKLRFEGPSPHVTELGMVTEVANSVKIGAIDVSIIWDATVAQYPDLEAVHIPSLDAIERHVSAAVLKCSTQIPAVLHFARYLAAKDKGLVEFAKRGYKTVNGDTWKEKPELTVFAGAMLRPAVEKSLNEFEAREGVQITRVYNGCGVLCAQMKTGSVPDAFLACDASFMRNAQEYFNSPTTLSTNDIVILVGKGNPKQIKSAQDLTREGLKIGIGHESQAALGALTKTKLQTAGIWEAVLKNVKVQSPTGDYLVNQLRTGSLDAVVVYASNANAVNETETVQLSLPDSFAVQEMAAGKQTPSGQMVQRLLKYINSKERFEQAGFHWKGEPNGSSR